MAQGACKSCAQRNGDYMRAAKSSKLAGAASFSLRSSSSGLPVEIARGNISLWFAAFTARLRL